MLAGQAVRTIGQMVSVVVYARLLAPSDFGLVAMVTAIIGVGALLRDFGLSQAAVQAKYLPHGAKSNLFWWNLGLGAVVALLVGLLASPIAAFYGQPRLERVVWALCPIFVLGGAATQFRAQLSRDLRFGRTVSSEVGAQIIGLIFGIAFAAAGAGYWSMICQQLTEATGVLIISIFASGWRPGIYSRREPMRRYLSYGWNLVGTQAIVYASQNVDSVMIGRNFGPSALGGYNRAFQLLMLPINQISSPATKVALPVLSRLNDDEDRYNQFLVRAQLLVSSVVCLGLLFVVATANQVVGIVLGDKWESTAHYFRILAVAGCFQSLSYATYWVFLSRGKTKANLQLTLVTRAVVIGAIVLGASWSVSGVALAYSAGLALSWPLGLMWIRKFAPAGRMLFTGLRVLLLATVGALCCHEVISVAGISSNVLALAAGVGAMALAVGVLVAVVPRYRADVRDLRNTIRLLKG